MEPRVKLIINADDGNLTDGVTKGVLLAHDKGIVTSTTIFANLNLSDGLKEVFVKRPELGVGVHLNITLGSPVAPLSDVRRLLAGNKFGKHDQEFFKQIDRKALYTEYKAQVEKFEDWFGKPPTHVDTHHHLHRFEPVFRVLMEIAEEFAVPFRLSECVDLKARKRLEERGIPLADHLIADINPHPHFARKRLTEVLADLPDGIVEMMTHPAIIDEDLRKISSFVDERSEELEALCDDSVRLIVKQADIELTNYGKLNSLVG